MKSLEDMMKEGTRSQQRTAGAIGILVFLIGVGMAYTTNEEFSAGIAVTSDDSALAETQITIAEENALNGEATSTDTPAQDSLFVDRFTLAVTATVLGAIICVAYLRRRRQEFFQLELG